MTAPSTDLDPTSTEGFIGHFEIDAAGVPFYKWPPWPSQPADAVITPFTAFVPRGILASRNARGEEVDSLGLPTVKLPVRHPRDQAGGGEYSFTKVNKKKRKTGFGDGAAPTWDQIWAEADRAVPARLYNPLVNQQDRLAQAISEFQVGRQWTPDLQSIFDSLRQFLGLATNPNQNAGLASNDLPADDDMDSLDGSGSDISESALEGAQYLREQMMQRFLDEPDIAVRVFLSSYFSQMGLLWVYGKLDSAPLFVRFFLHFLLKNSVFPELKRSLERAVAVADVARVELPGTWRTSQALARDAFGRLCTEVFGSTASGGLPVPRLDDDGWRVDYGPKRLDEYIPSDILPGLACSHAEVSCRRIARIVPPNPASVGLDAALGMLVLEPWDGPFSQDIPPPHHLSFPGFSGQGMASSSSSIDVYVTPNALQDVCVGLGVQGTWVCVAPKPDLALTPCEVDQRSALTGWWFMETVAGTFPSYWANDDFEAA
ncbi:hypothetical protein EXIGLDRAFT_839868 [Exidia glandulosa HHB12029]|uniref:Uncharacterized protein n=1 Tax=Exidia glandulosa HHB12029 TaxID=1314781 RepID=A0A165ESN8_EXIGL|nr:hypothetical protein EXIGLDRAFT_839868 [Exidia glandulosa HHB12029]